MGGRRNAVIAETGPLGGSAPAHPRAQQTWLKVYRIESLSEQDNRCYYCREPLRQRTATADHLVPQRDGGRVTRENIRAACQPCNRTKGHMTEQKFKKLIRQRSSDHYSTAMAIFRYRLWVRTEQAEKRILKYVGLE